MRLGLHICAIYFAVLTTSVAFGQTDVTRPFKVVTVCDILLDPSKFNGKLIVVLGRFAASDEGSWLVEDKCDRQVDGKNGTTSNMDVWLNQQGRDPSTQLAMPSIDPDSLKAKLEQAGKNTKLGRHIQYQCTISFLEKDAKPECDWPEVSDQWALVYGRVETMGDRTYGFGHLSGSPAQVLVQASATVDENGHPKRY